MQYGRNCTNLNQGKFGVGAIEQWLQLELQGLSGESVNDGIKAA